MNLHARAAGAIGRVNPHKRGTLYVNLGYATLATGKRQPSYSIYEDVEMQAQPLSTGELVLVQGLGYQGVKRAVYLYGTVSGMVRKDGTGGDILEFDDTRWLVIEVLEQWNGWCKVAVVEQLDPIGVLGVGAATVAGVTSQGAGTVA